MFQAQVVLARKPKRSRLSKLAEPPKPIDTRPVETTAENPNTQAG